MYNRGAGYVTQALGYSPRASCPRAPRGACRGSLPPPHAPLALEDPTGRARLPAEGGPWLVTHWRGHRWPARHPSGAPAAPAAAASALPVTGVTPADLTPASCSLRTLDGLGVQHVKATSAHPGRLRARGQLSPPGGGGQATATEQLDLREGGCGDPSGMPRHPTLGPPELRLRGECRGNTTGREPPGVFRASFFLYPRQGLRPRVLSESAGWLPSVRTKPER